MTAVLVLIALAADPPKPAFVGIQISARIKPGILVIEAVLPDSPARKGGILGGDVLLRIDGVTPENLKSAVDAIRALKPGRKATFRVLRDGKERDVEVIPVPR